MRKSFLCLIGLHEWHEHEHHAEKVYIKRSNPCLYWFDKICLKCGYEKRIASKLRAKEAAKRDRVAFAERRLLDEPH